MSRDGGPKAAVRRRIGRTGRQHLTRLTRPVRWGGLRSISPISDRFGYDRGTPVDRHYMDAHLGEHADAVHGVVGEIASSRATRTFGGDRVRVAEVIDVDPDNAEATIIADVGTAGALPLAHFDCLIVQQTLQYVPAPAAALRTLHAALRPGGTLLLAMPALTAHDAKEREEDDLWRFWPAGVARLLTEAVPDARTVVRGYGNLLAATAFLHGIAAEELRAGELAHEDPRFPVVVCASVTRAGAP